MKLVLTHDEAIINFGDISHHLELEAECVEANHIATLVAQLRQCKGIGLSAMDTKRVERMLKLQIWLQKVGITSSIIKARKARRI